MRGVIQEPKWTPFVTAPIGAAPTSSRHISRATSPWSFATPFARAAVRSASGVRPNQSSPGALPSSLSSGHESPASPAIGST